MCSKSAQNGSYVKLNSVTFGSLVLDGRASTFRTVWPLLTAPVLELSVLELPVTVLCLLPLDFLCLLIYALLLTEAIAVFSRLFPTYRLFVLQQLLYTVCVFLSTISLFFRALACRHFTCSQVIFLPCELVMSTASACEQ